MWKIISYFEFFVHICMPIDYRNLAMMLNICYLDGLFDTVDNGWRYDFALGGVPSLCLFVGFIFCPESPRYRLEGCHRNYVPKKFRGIDSERFSLFYGKKWSFLGILCVSELSIPRFGTERNGTELNSAKHIFQKSLIWFSLSLNSSERAFNGFFSFA